MVQRAIFAREGEDRSDHGGKPEFLFARAKEIRHREIAYLVN